MAIYVAGRINVDFIIGVDGVIASSRKYRGRVLEVDVGGTAANIATAIARVDRSLRPSLLGAIGSDYEGFVRDRLSLDGVEVKHVVTLSSETGKAYVFLDPLGETTIVTIPGANDLYGENHVPSVVDADAIVIGNTTTSAILKILRSVGSEKPLFVDPHSLWRDIANIISSMSNPCVYLPNENEFVSYTGIDVENIYSVKSYAENIGCSVIVKRGIQGVIAIHRGELIKIPAIQLEQMGMKVVSTAGCGDTFTGVFVAVYMIKKDFVEGLRYATCAAALKATKLSSRASPSREELERFIDVVEHRGLLDIRVERL